MFYSGENSIVLPIEKFPSLALPKTAVKWTLPIGNRLHEVLNMIIWHGKIWNLGKLVADMRRGGRLQEVFATGASALSWNWIWETAINLKDRFRFYRQCRIWSFHVVDLQKTEKKCTRVIIYNVQELWLFTTFPAISFQIISRKTIRGVSIILGRTGHHMTPSSTLQAWGWGIFLKNNLKHYLMCRILFLTCFALLG